MNEIIKTDKIDHIGMVVPDIEKALEHYKNVFNKIGSKPIISETQNVKISFVEFSNVKLELIEPISDKSPISNFLKKNPVKGPVGTPKNPAKKPIPDPNEQDVKLFTGPLYFHPETNINVARIIKIPIKNVMSGISL